MLNTIARTPVGALTSYERTLTWCILTLLSAPGHAPPEQLRVATESSVPSASAPSRDCRLTAREREVLGLVALGLTNRQIAARLFLSRRTVEQHLSSIYNRLGVSTRAAATRFALLNNLC